METFMNLLLFLPGMKKYFRILLALVLLLSAIFILVAILFVPQPMQIVLETGQEVVTSNSSYFSITNAIFLIVASSVIGASITYLFYNADRDMMARVLPRRVASARYNALLPLLKTDEQRVVKMLRDRKGAMLQNELVLSLGLSKVKVTRVLASLERKGIIARERHGLTNRVRFLEDGVS